MGNCQGVTVRNLTVVGLYRTTIYFSFGAQSLDPKNGIVRIVKAEQ